MEHLQRCANKLLRVRGTRGKHNERDVQCSLFVGIKEKVHGTSNSTAQCEERFERSKIYVIGKLECPFSCFENEMFPEENTTNNYYSGYCSAPF